jgi:DNA-binding NarL/FixJ family response regulator
VLVTGEPGIGKTTVVEQATRAAGGPVLLGRAVVDDGAPAFWPWLRLLDQPAAAALGLGPELLDLGADDGFEPAAAARFQVVERTTRALVAAAEAAGLTVVLDDLQWADDASLQLLRYLCGELAGARILVLGTCRDPDGTDATPALLTEITGLAAVHVLRLPPLRTADTASYLAAVGGPDVDASWAGEVQRHSGGNPLFVRELVRLLVQEDRLGKPADRLPVPAELRRLVGYRLGRLGAQCHRLLGGCAAIGDEVDLVLLAAAAPDPDSVSPALLAEAVAAGVLVEDADAPTRLRFSHGLVRQAAYESLDRDDRVGWHRRVAAALGAGGHREERAADLARHTIRAAVDAASSRAAVDACRAAAAVASRRLAFDDAARWLRHAVELLGPAGAGAEERAETLLALAEASYQDGQVTEAVAHCETVAGLAERHDRADLLAAAAVVVRAVSGPVVAAAGLCERARARLGDEDSARHARVLAQHAWIHAELGRPQDAAPLSERALAMAERSGDTTALVAAFDARHHALDYAGWVAERLALGARALEIATAQNRPDAALWAHLWRIDAGYQIGSITTVDTELRALDALTDRLAWPLARWHLLRARASRALLAGDFADAESTALAFRDVGAQTQDLAAQGLFYAFIASVLQKTGRFDDYPEMPWVADGSAHLPIVQAYVGLYALYQGDREKADRLYGRLRPTLADLPREARWLPTVTGGGELAVRLGDPEAAALCYELLLPFSRQYVNACTSIWGSVARTLGLIASALGRHDDADRHLGDAVAMERRIGALPDLALAELAHAQALVARGGPDDRDRARVLSASALRTARRLAMGPTAAAAAALADELAGIRPDAAAGLTAREREIAGLVAAGLPNRAIAQRLVLSERTVETHVRNLLTKLGLANRTQVAGWAVRAGLGGPTT